MFGFRLRCLLHDATLSCVSTLVILLVFEALASTTPVFRWLTYVLRWLGLIQTDQWEAATLAGHYLAAWIALECALLALLVCLGGLHRPRPR